MKKLVRKASQLDADADSFATDAEAASDSEVAPKDGRFLDITSFKTGLPFDATAAKILPGSALVVRHLLNSGSKDVDALYYVHDRKFQEDGVLCECTFVGASGKAHSDFQNIKKGTDHILHLCSSTNGCPSLRKRSSIVHALVWKPLAFSKLTDPWITSSMLSRFEKLLEETGSESDAGENFLPVPERRGALMKAVKPPTQTERRAQALQAFSKAGSITSPRPAAAVKKVSFSGQGNDSEISSKQDEVPDDEPLPKFPPVPPPEIPERTTQVTPATSDSKALARLKQRAEEGLSEREIEEAAPLDKNAALFSELDNDDSKDAVIKRLKLRLGELKKSFVPAASLRSKNDSDRRHNDKSSGSSSRTVTGSSSLSKNLLSQSLRRSGDRMMMRTFQPQASSVTFPLRIDRCARSQTRRLPTVTVTSASRARRKRKRRRKTRKKNTHQVQHQFLLPSPHDRLARRSFFTKPGALQMDWRTVFHSRQPGDPADFSSKHFRPW